NVSAIMFFDAIRCFDCGAAGIDIDEMPRRYGAFVIKAGFRLYERSRAKIGPGEFLFARPSQTNRLSRRLRKPGGFHRRFAGMFAAESGAEIGHNHSHFLVCEMKRASQLAPVAEGVLSTSPNREAAVSPLGDGGARF